MLYGFILYLYAVEWQLYLPLRQQHGGLRIIADRNRGVFAGRHLETGEYVNQSRLVLQQAEPHSCEQNHKLK